MDLPRRYVADEDEDEGEDEGEDEAPRGHHSAALTSL